MDWGLFRSKEKGKEFLRPKILFPSWFYYYAIISNFLLRFVWVITLFSGLPSWIYNTQILIIVLTIAEGFRRAQWSIIRLENE